MSQLLIALAAVLTTPAQLDRSEFATDQLVIVTTATGHQLQGLIDDRSDDEQLVIAVESATTKIRYAIPRQHIQSIVADQAADQDHAATMAQQAHQALFSK